MKLLYSFGILIILTFVHSAPNFPSTPFGLETKQSAFQEGVKVGKESKVTITVGEKDGHFAYTVNGYTLSPYKISVSGEYFNDAVSHYGYARIFLVVDSGVAYYALRPRGNKLDAYMLNGAQAEFFFEIICPRQVSAYHLQEGQINATTVLITGPSSSSFSLLNA